MNDEVILALDQGTTSSRTLAFDRNGEVVASAQREFAQHYPQSGWVEHDGEEIWKCQSATLKEVLGQLEAEGRRAVAMGITNQRETTLVWERKTGELIHRAIVWQDRRTADFCEELQEKGCEELVRARTGLRLDPYFSGTKVRWLLENVPGARERAEKGELCFGTIDSWLLWKLTKGAVHATDVTNASRTLLFDIEKQRWDEELCELLEVPMTMLPEVKECSDSFGEWEGISIAGVAGDQHAALFGQSCFEAGMAKSTYGTGCFLLMNTGAEVVASENGLLSTVAWSRNGEVSYALEGSVFMAGAILNWLRDGLGMIEDAAEVEPLALQCVSSEGVVLVPAFTGLGAPHWDPETRAALLGMSRGTGKPEVCRAALESIAFQCGEVLRAMEKDSGVKLKTLRVDGGAARGNLLMQIQADCVGVKVARPSCLETTALGAACFAGLQVGFWKDLAELEGLLGVEREFVPQEEVGVDWDLWNRAVATVISFA
ncbi:MAG: glycerol kinase GlpK [Roseibacillus sp.]